jgi:hypothetical protein
MAPGMKPYLYLSGGCWCGTSYRGVVSVICICRAVTHYDDGVVGQGSGAGVANQKVAGNKTGCAPPTVEA